MARGRIIGVVVATAALAACGSALDNSWSGDESFESPQHAWYLDYPESDRSTVASALDARASGFAMGADQATVAMNDMTCGVQIDTGSVFFDLDLRDGEIQDGVSDGERHLTSLMVAPPLVTLIPADQPLGGEQYLVRGVRQARMLDDHSFVALSTEADGSCGLRWYTNSQLATHLTLNGASCEGDLGFAIDRITGDAFVASPDGVFAVEGALEGRPEVVDLDLDADLIAWDPTHSRLYAAARGESWLAAVDGVEPLWAMELPGPVVDLDSAGAPGGLVVAHEDELAHSIVRLDAQGAELDFLPFDQTVLDVEVNDAGTVMAVARFDDHAYYRIR